MIIGDEVHRRRRRLGEAQGGHAEADGIGDCTAIARLLKRLA
jgi:hypothetical protein